MGGRRGRREGGGQKGWGEGEGEEEGEGERMVQGIKHFSFKPYIVLPLYPSFTPLCLSICPPPPTTVPALYPEPPQLLKKGGRGARSTEKNLKCL